MHQVDNAVIMAAGTSSRFAPLSYEKPKALIPVKGEILIERQIRQLKEAGVPEIYIVVGYKAEQFRYLEEKFSVRIIENPDYLVRNNNGSIYAARNILGNSYICSADNYFSENPFEREVSECYYAAVYGEGYTKEWCMECDETGRIRQVQIGGENAWYMLGHVFWDKTFSKKFLEILEKEYDKPETAGLLWESIYISHIEEFEMYIRKYSSDVVFEFDTLDELREFDTSYENDTRSDILKFVAKELSCEEKDIREVLAFKDGTTEAAGFTFFAGDKRYQYSYKEKTLREI